jgi:predicted nuclease of predicted toxin-antitoxin system
MKLLIDENISYRIIKLIENYFPGSIHVSSISNSRLTDLEIWKHAKDNNFIIVTHDEDYYEWQLIRENPPKTIWLRFGNTPTEIIPKEYLILLYWCLIIGYYAILIGY